MSLFSFFGKSGNDPENVDGDKVPLSSLEGKLARAKTSLQSMGFIAIGGQTYEAMSTVGFIPEGSLVKITGQSMGHLTVETAE